MGDKFCVMFYSKYWDSSFFEHAKHSDLIEQFNMATKDLDPRKLYQISMDGREKAIFHTFIDIGSCSLHVVHGSLKTGTNKSSWKIKKTMKGVFYVLHDTLARQEDHTAAAKLTTFMNHIYEM